MMQALQRLPQNCCGSLTYGLIIQKIGYLIMHFRHIRKQQGLIASAQCLGTKWAAFFPWPSITVKLMQLLSKH